MSLTVELSFGERFLDWYAKNTKLYIRGQKGKDFTESMKLDVELASQLNNFFYNLREIKDLTEIRKETDKTIDKLKTIIDDLESV